MAGKESNMRLLILPDGFLSALIVNGIRFKVHKRRFMQNKEDNIINSGEL